MPYLKTNSRHFLDGTAMRNWSLGAYERNGASGMWELPGGGANGVRRLTEMADVIREKKSVF